MKPWLPWRYKGAVNPKGAVFIGGLYSSKCAVFFTWNDKNRIQHSYPVYLTGNLAMVKLHCSRQCLWSTASRRTPIHSPMTALVITIPPIWWLGDGAFMTLLKTHINRGFMGFIYTQRWWDSHLGLMTLALLRLDEHGVDAAYRSLPCWCVKTWKKLWKTEFSQWYMIWKW